MNVSIFKLCKELLKISTVIIPDPLTRILLKALIESVSEQTANINQKLDKILDAPYKNGLNFLTNANLASSPTMKQESIKDALKQFVDASNKAMTTMAKAQSLFYVGVCLNLLNEPIAALEWYEKAYQTGWNHRLALLENIKKGTGIQILALATIRSPSIVSSLYYMIRKELGTDSIVIKTPELVKASIQAEKNKSEFVSLNQNLLMPLRELLQSKSLSLPILQEPLESNWVVP